MNPVYILSAVRTPIGKFGGSLASQTAADMGIVAAKAAIERAGIQPDQVEETIFGNARQAGGGPIPLVKSPSAAASLRKFPAYTVNKACASGIKSIALGFQEIALAISTACSSAERNPCRAFLIISTPRAGVIGSAISHWSTACTVTVSFARWQKW